MRANPRLLTAALWALAAGFWAACLALVRIVVR